MKATRGSSIPKEELKNRRVRMKRKKVVAIPWQEVTETSYGPAEILIERDEQGILKVRNVKQTSLTIVNGVGSKEQLGGVKERRERGEASLSPAAEPAVPLTGHSQPVHAPQLHAPNPAGGTYKAARSWRRGSAPQRPRRPGPAAALAGLAIAALLIPAVLAWPREETPPPSPAPAVQGQTAPAAPAKNPIAAEPPALVPDTTPAPKPAVVYPEPEVRVYLTKTGTIDKVTMEEYVTGVVAAEMPSDFGIEALKAQAIAARTFVTKRMAAGDHSGIPVEGADVKDTVEHQVYIPYSKLEAHFKEAGKEKDWAKLKQAVRESKDTIMTYKGEPITASFFSTSNGYTENSEDVWQQAVPYLRSVESPWDAKIAPGYEGSVTMSRIDFLNKLNVTSDAIPVSVGGKKAKPFIQVLSKTAGNRIKEIQVGKKVFTGIEIREKLGLRSTEFTWKTNGDEITITTHGYGHGVGMSQYGANGMAQEGYTATQILKHYYNGVAFGQASKLLYKGKS
ncbi:stage II sporulation protein D [Paenibacillus polygoni]|uniref:Stage II sporulation protein D n=1 Tax=Paenibacillus polygoni TaxID=3050112 RepID=A0ABY8X384_9BACL|nr:stage II sporulation protein D [Paenibacillus polygoni]WIV18931.1 stage II sporulation protein D [Paenibacillus polygoni]